MFHMKQMTKLLIVFALIIQIIIPTPLKANYSLPVINAKAALLGSVNGDGIFFEKDIDEQLAIASITKLFSMSLILNEIKEKKINIDQEINISERVSLLKAQSKDISGVWYNHGQSIRIEELIKLAIVYSDNGATIQLAELVFGNEQKCVDLMNEYVENIGLMNTRFYNVSGLTMVDYGELILPGTKPADYNYSTARELTIGIKRILSETPELLEYTKINKVEYKGETLNSYNLMLEGLPFYYPGVSGLKTGTSLESGSSFVGYYDNGEEQFLSVILGADSSLTRFSETQKLYNWIDSQTIETVINNEYGFDVDIKGDLSFKNELFIRENILSANGNGIDIKLENLTFNPNFFNDKGTLVKNIPKGETVATVEIESAKEGKTPPIIREKDGVKYIELVSNKDIKVQNKVIQFILSIPSFYSTLFNYINI